MFLDVASAWGPLQTNRPSIMGAAFLEGGLGVARKCCELFGFLHGPKPVFWEAFPGPTATHQKTMQWSVLINIKQQTNPKKVSQLSLIHI